jgi:hypothetical protein
MDGRFCEIIAESIKDPKNNNYQAFDSIQDERSGKWDNQILKYAVMKSTADIEQFSLLKRAVNITMTMWDIETELKLTYSDDNPQVRIYFKSSIEEKYFKERPSTLAFAYYPAQGNASGIIVINDDYFWNLDGDQVEAYLVDPIHYTKGDGVFIKGYNLISVLGHEFGHTLGLTHSVEKEEDLMRPYYDQNIRWISVNDVNRMLLKYPESIGGIWYNSRMRAWVRRRILRFSL